jgi:SAM-dependent methyltransferase
MQAQPALTALRVSHVSLYSCPQCHGDLVLRWQDLHCKKCHVRFLVKNGIPRFVPPGNYSASFGYQWNLHAKTQYDSYTGVPVSRQRLFAETRWPEQMPGQKILEVGSGAGRFTEPLSTTGATILSLDYSSAVEANALSNACKSNVAIGQASIYEMPIRPESFDKVLCIGVLQHTPDVKAAFRALVNALKPGGELVIDVYRWRLVNWIWPRYWLRPLTKRLPAARLYSLCDRYVRWIWPLTRLLHHLPMGRQLNRFILVPDFRDLYPLNEEVLQSWAVLDTFDNLSATYDKPQTVTAVQSWFKKAGFVDFEVHRGINGIEARGRKPLPTDS